MVIKFIWNYEHQRFTIDKMNQILKNIITPFNWKKATKGLDWKGKTIAILYFPSIL